MKINIEEIVTSKRWKNIMKYLYGWGAAVVILGALFKILHLPGATFMLFAGMGTEAIIFFFSAFEPIAEEYDWALVFPELSGMTDEEEIKNFSGSRRGGGLSADELQAAFVNALAASGSNFGGSAQPQQIAATSAPAPVAAAPVVVQGGGGMVFTEKFNAMLEKAEIGPELFDKVGAGLRKLGEASNKIADMSGSAIATKDFADKMAKANESMTALNDNIAKSSEAMSGIGAQFADGIQSSVRGLESSLAQAGSHVAEQLNTVGNNLSTSYQQLAESMKANTMSISNGSTSYSQQLEQLNKNMSALNAAHELHLNETTQRLKDAQSVYAGVDDMTKKLKETIDGTEKFSKALELLNNNVSSLNSVYGNMLSAIASLSK